MIDLKGQGKCILIYERCLTLSALSSPKDFNVNNSVQAEGAAWICIPFENMYPVTMIAVKHEKTYGKIKLLLKKKVLFFRMFFNPLQTVFIVSKTIINLLPKRCKIKFLF
jgi:hypothetical protein